MAQARSDTSAIAGMVEQMQEIAGFNPLIGPQTEHFWEAQDNILSEAETFARRWFERRHTATRTALEAAKQVTQNGGADPAEAVRVMTDWQAHSMERVVEDLQEWIDLCSCCAGHLTRAETEAGEEALEETAKKISAGTKKKVSTPV